MPATDNTDPLANKTKTPIFSSLNLKVFNKPCGRGNIAHKSRDLIGFNTFTTALEVF